MATTEMNCLASGGSNRGVSATFTNITPSNPISFDCGFAPKYVCIGSLHQNSAVGVIIEEYIEGTYYQTTSGGWRVSSGFTPRMSVNGTTVTYTPADSGWGTNYLFCATEEYEGNL